MIIYSMSQANREHKMLSFLCCFDLNVCFALIYFACSDRSDHMNVSHSLAKHAASPPPSKTKLHDSLQRREHVFDLVSLAGCVWLQQFNVSPEPARGLTCQWALPTFFLPLSHEENPHFIKVGGRYESGFSRDEISHAVRDKAGV